MSETLLVLHADASFVMKDDLIADALQHESKTVPLSRDAVSTENDLVVIKESEIHGLGLFARRDIREGTWIVQYMGPTVGLEEKRLMTVSDKRYLFKLQGDYSIDGRYINHKCSANNCEVADKHVDGNKFQQIWIVAKRFIKAGEELTYSYGKNYWSGDRTCCCGSHLCFSRDKRKAERSM